MSEVTAMTAPSEGVSERERFRASPRLRRKGAGDTAVDPAVQPRPRAVPATMIVKGNV